MKNRYQIAAAASILIAMSIVLMMGCSKSYAPSHSSKKLGYPVWNGKAGVGWYTEDTSAAEFTVRSAEELAGLAELVTGGNSFKGKTITLGANIMLNDTAKWRSWTGDKPPANAWTPIGSPPRSSDSGGDKSRSFNGVFRGNGFAVSGVYISGSGSSQGLFGVIDSGAVIESLGVAASYIRGWDNVGGLAGVAVGAKIMGCYFSGAVLGVHRVGGIAGTSGAEVTVSGCHTAGAVTGLGKERTDYKWYTVLGDSHIGGLVGDNKGMVVGSYSTAAVTGTGVRDDYITPLAEPPSGYIDYEILGRIGGLVGANSGTVDGSFFSGKVTGHYSEEGIGGLAGFNDDGGAVLNSYFIGAVIGCRDVGGLVGSNDGLICNSYSAGTVTEKDGDDGYGVCDVIGGLAGRSSDGMVSNSYSTTKVIGEKRSTGGLVGLKSLGIGGAAMNAYYDKQTSGQSDTGKGVGKTTAEMTSKRFADSLNVIASISSMNAWIYSEGKYPVLSGQKAAPAKIGAFFESGVGTEADPYTIKTKEQLKNFSWLVGNGVFFSDKYIRLDADIALNDTANWQKWEDLQNDSAFRGLAKNDSIDRWTPIGNHHYQFRGNFDGNGFVVSGVFINSDQYSQGLFGAVGRSGTVKNLGTAFFYVKADYSIGGLAGENYGAISNCYSYGITAGKGYVGGLVGENGGTISACFSAGKAAGRYKVGGFVGRNYANGTVKNSYSVVDAIGARYNFSGLGEIEGMVIGGFVGHNDSGKIITSYSVGIVVGRNRDAGGFAGSNRFLKKKDGKSYIGITPLSDSFYESAIIEGSYYDSETSGRSSGIGERIGEQTVVGKSTEEMKQQATFVGWDFDGVWGIDGKVNGGYPYLRGTRSGD